MTIDVTSTQTNSSTQYPEIKNGHWYWVTPTGTTDDWSELCQIVSVDHKKVVFETYEARTYWGYKKTGRAHNMNISNFLMKAIRDYSK